MTDFSIIEQALLTCDAPEHVWRPALDALRAPMDAAYEEAYRALAGIKLVGNIDGWDVIRKDAVLDLIAQRLPYRN